MEYIAYSLIQNMFAFPTNLYALSIAIARYVSMYNHVISHLAGQS